MWTRNNDVLNWNMLKHFIYLSSDKSTTSSLCSLYYRYSLKSSSFFCILSFLVRTISIDQTFYSVTHYLAAVWLDSRHELNTWHTSWITCWNDSFEISKSIVLWYQWISRSVTVSLQYFRIFLSLIKSLFMMTLITQADSMSQTF